MTPTRRTLFMGAAALSDQIAYTSGNRSTILTVAIASENNNQLVVDDGRNNNEICAD